MFNRPAAPGARRWFTGVALAATVVAAPTAAAAPDPATSWHGRAIERPRAGALGGAARVAARLVRRPGRHRRGLGPCVASRAGRAARVARPRVSRRPRRRTLRSPYPRRRQLVSDQARTPEPTGRVDAATLAELHTRRDPRVTLARTAEPTPTPTPTLAAVARASLVQCGRRRRAGARAGRDAGADRAVLAPEPAGAARRAATPVRGLAHGARATSSSIRTAPARTSGSPSPRPRSPPGATRATGTWSA